MNTERTFQATTVRLPKSVYEQAKAVVKKGSAAASSINDFLVEAVQDKLRQLREKEIDAAFAGMANDAEYRQSAIEMAQSFEKSDWEAYQASEAAATQNAHTKPKTRSAKTKAR
jgi:hypothetical protein